MNVNAGICKGHRGDRSLRNDWIISRVTGGCDLGPL